MFSELVHKIAVRSLLIAFCCLCLIGDVSAQRASMDPDTGDMGTGGIYMIQGTLLFPTGQRVDRPMRVRLFTLSRGDITTMSDTNGNFSFRRLRPGSYTIIIDNEKEFEPVNEPTSIIQAGRSVGSTESIIPVQIRLKLRGGSSVKPAVVHADLANVPKPAVELYESAVALAKSGKTKAAIDKLNQALVAHPDFMLAYNELGVQYLALGQLEKADEALKSALQISPDAFTALANHGIVLVRLKRYAEAEVDLRKAMKINDQSPIVRFYLGRALAYLGRFDEGAKELQAAVTLGGDQMKEAHRYLGAIYHAQGDNERAIEQLEIYLRIAPKAEDAEQVRQLIKQLKEKK